MKEYALIKSRVNLSRLNQALALISDDKVYSEMLSGYFVLVFNKKTSKFHYAYRHYTKISLLLIDNTLVLFENASEMT